VSLWNSGEQQVQKKEFLHVNDLAQAVCYALENPLEEHLYNVGTDLSIKDLAE
jgi:GDP-L-fucose synthase